MLMTCYKCLVVSEEDEKMFAGGQGFNLDFTTVVAYCGFIEALHFCWKRGL